MNSWYLILESELPNEICDSIIEVYKSEQSQDGQYGDKTTNSNYRSSKVVGLPYGSPSGFEINNYIQNYIVHVNAECFGLDLNNLYEFQIAEYKDNGHYDRHFDMRLDNRSSVRKLSVSVQLSDSNEYEGGDFLFSDDIGTPAQSVLRKKGTIIIFPSFIYHKITPVTSGTRYSLVGWYEGKNWT